MIDEYTHSGIEYGRRQRVISNDNHTLKGRTEHYGRDDQKPE